MQSTLYESILQKGYSKGEAKGLEKGLGKGRQEERRVAVLDLCELLSIEIGPERRARLEALDLDQLAALRTHLKAQRSWPDSI